MRLTAILLGLCTVTTTLASPLEAYDRRDSAGTVLVPGLGYIPKSSAHQVPSGSIIQHAGDQIHVISATGEILQTTKMDTSTSSLQRPQKRAPASGWIVAGQWTNTGSSIRAFGANWTVPPIPETNSGQTIFIFNAIEPGSFNAILQPVLQYGGSAAGGGAYWAVASWYLVGSSTFFTSPVKVSVGDGLSGVIHLLSQSGSSFNYDCYFDGIDGTALTANGAAELVWVTETLEAYGIVDEDTNYPTGNHDFLDIRLFFTGTIPSVVWGIDDYDTSDDITAEVLIQGGDSGRIRIHYPGSS